MIPNQVVNNSQVTLFIAVHSPYRNFPGSSPKGLSSSWFVIISLSNIFSKSGNVIPKLCEDIPDLGFVTIKKAGGEVLRV
jgi:hypothetical protein